MEWTMAHPDMAEAAGIIVSRLLEKGYEAFWVGGCIRDELLHRPVHDMDITTSALPDQILSIFPRCIPTGLQHGTITVLQGKYAFEVTTYRTESGYSDHRRPEQVVFVKEVKEDLRRRDFTINAMACGMDGLLIDPFGGADDLQRRVVRCVGDAEERFEEDALRMLRCVRFASTLGFSVAKNTWRGLLRQRDKLAHIAVERVRAELERIVEGPHPRRGLGMLSRSGLLLRGKAPFPVAGTDLAAAAADVAGIGELESARLRWALLLHALGRSAGEADELLRAWTFPGATRTGVAGVLRVREAWTASMAEVPPGDPDGTDKLRRRWIAAVLAYGPDAACGWLALLRVLPPGSASAACVPQPEVPAEGTFAPEPEDFPSMAETWMSQMPVTSLAGLVVGGKDLTENLNRRPGPWVGEILDKLLLAAAAGDIPNDRQLLLAEAKRMVGHEQL
ncbi:CCA tRNA nucleotidyltransferase [Paenibacillus sp. BR2-3]|uniref:CCA tRNA nucleotidyltransferase n=1 Tax=Paenibacillus sp. BR2-3 TaxID=3048494 RepID=UPI003977A985